MCKDIYSLLSLGSSQGQLSSYFPYCIFKTIFPHLLLVSVEHTTCNFPITFPLSFLCFFFFWRQVFPHNSMYTWLRNLRATLSAEINVVKVMHTTRQSSIICLPVCFVMEEREDKKKKWKTLVKVTNIFLVQDIPGWNYFNLQTYRDKKDLLWKSQYSL